MTPFTLISLMQPKVLPPSTQPEIRCSPIVGPHPAQRISIVLPRPSVSPNLAGKSKHQVTRNHLKLQPIFRMKWIWPISSIKSLAFLILVSALILKTSGALTLENTSIVIERISQGFTQISRTPLLPRHVPNAKHHRRGPGHRHCSLSWSGNDSPLLSHTGNSTCRLGGYDLCCRWHVYHHSLVRFVDHYSQESFSQSDEDQSASIQHSIRPARTWQRYGHHRVGTDAVYRKLVIFSNIFDVHNLLS